MCLMACCIGSVRADLQVYGGVTVDIDEVVEGWVWVYGATINLYENAWIKDSNGTAGEIWADSGSVVNIYGGKIDSLLYVTTSYDASMPETVVTVYGSQFTNDGVPVEPGTPEVRLNNKALGGVYESGTPFSFMVWCVSEGDFYLTVKLGWIDSSPVIDVSPDTAAFGDVEVGVGESHYITIANTGSANLTLEAIDLVQDGDTAFVLMPLGQLPVTVEPNSFIAVEVIFAPLFEGPYEAYLQIISSDPENPFVEVLLTGTGVLAEEPELTIKEKMAIIDSFYKAGLADRTIYGTGPGRTGTARAAVVGMSLSVARNLINAGHSRLAVMPLESVAAKTSGKGWPRDFVAGSSVAELHVMVDDLLDDIKGEYSAAPRPKKYTKWHWWHKWHCRK